MHEWDGFMSVKGHVQCLCLHDSRKDDEVAVPVCAQEHGRYYPTPPPTHPTMGAQVSDMFCLGCAAQVSEISDAQVSA